MSKIMIEVINSAIRYNKVRYEVGEITEVLSEHIVPKFMKVLGEKSTDQSPITYEEKPLVLNEEGLKALSLDGLKDYAWEFGIKLGKARTEEGIIAKILESQKGE